MGQQSSSYRIAGYAIVLCFIIAGVITFFSSSDNNPVGTENTRERVVIDINDKTQDLSPNVTAEKSRKIRVLWYDDGGKTYTFRDYDRGNGADDHPWTEADLPAPDNGTLQKKAAMIRFLEWDGTIERMTDTKYLVDQDRITSILNSYTLIAPPPPSSEGPKPTQIMEKTSLTPEITPSPGMLIPTSAQPCNRGDGTIQVTFGYTNRHNTQVSLPVGKNNQFSPGDPSRGQPTSFMPGVHPDAFSIVFPSNGTNIVWNLMGTSVGAGEVPLLESKFTIEPEAGYAPLDVRLVDHSFGGTSENPLTSVWDLGNGISARGDSIVSRYEKPGEYQVKHTVSSTCGEVTAQKNISVFESDFSSEPVRGSPATLQLNDRSTGDPTVWFWDFNDGASSWEQNPIHTWTSPGTYAVELTVSGKYGSGTVVKKITIS